MIEPFAAGRAGPLPEQTPGVRQIGPSAGSCKPASRRFDAARTGLQAGRPSQGVPIVWVPGGPIDQVYFSHTGYNLLSRHHRRMGISHNVLSRALMARWACKAGWASACRSRAPWCRSAANSRWSWQAGSNMRPAAVPLCTISSSATPKCSGRRPSKTPPVTPSTTVRHGCACRSLSRCADHIGSDQLPLTQEFLADMLGVRRTTGDAVGPGTAEEGILRYSRGRITQFSTVLRSRRRLANATTRSSTIMRGTRWA